MKSSVSTDSLTAVQRKAVEAVGQNVCVSAGAGTGKTRVLVERFLYLVENKLAHPREILAVTFTEKAAQAMKHRIADRFRDSGLEEARRELENAYIGTIHAFAARILREHPIEAGVDPAFRIFEEDEANLLKDLAFEALVEARFQEPEIFNLLHVYGDKALKNAVSFVARKIHTSGLRFQDIDSIQPTPDFTGEVLKALEPLRKLKGRENDCAEVEALLSKPVFGWREIEAVKTAGRRFQRRSEERMTFRDALDEWLGCAVEKLAFGVKSAFLNFCLDFEGRYSALKRERAGLDFDDLERQTVTLLSGTTPSQTAVRNLYQKHFKFIMVDEFQDTSVIQNQLISLVASPNNLFIVGDWKQSIYGFRGADASLFLKKEAELSSSEGRLSLIESFRSRSELLDQLNSFFGQLWAEGERAFEALVASRQVGDRQPSCLSPVLSAVEFFTIERAEKESVQEARVKEAKVLARRIQELVETGAYQYRDFVMLFRSGEDIFFYEYELGNLGIPYYVVSGRGFYHQLEIKDVISFLEVLDNPHLDIPLAAVLRSPLVQVTDDVLFWLANYSTRQKPQSPLYEALIRCGEISEIEGRDQERLKAFRSLFLEFLDRKEKRSISETIELVLDRTRYDRYVFSLAQGKRHFANLRKLLEVARELERREPLSLGDFIRYVKGLETQEVREAEAQVEALEGNVVKLMTVHKAKGLEFKVVLLPDLNRKMKSERSYFLFDSEFGLGLKAFNEITREFEETASFRKIKEKSVRRAYEESKRLLYVAMTRACDHLILSGASHADENGSDESEPGDKSNWYEWLNQWLPKENPHVIRTLVREIPAKSGRIPSPFAEHKKIRTALESGEPISVKPVPEVQDILDALKPIQPVFFERVDLPVSAFSVFERDQEEFRRVYEIGALPEEAAKIEEWTPDEDEDEIKPAEFGTVIHKIFEYLVVQPEKASQRFSDLVLRFTRDLDEKTREEIKTLSAQFLKSKLFSEIKNAKARYAEIPFVFRLQGGIVQGTLDLLYQTADGKWVILDYKTSKIENDVEELANQYKTQLMLYALACHELLKIPVSRASLYFVRSDQVYDFLLEAVDFAELKGKFELLQKSIIEKRKIWTGKP